MSRSIVVGGPSEVRRRPEDVAVDWLDHVLRSAGRLRGAARLVGLAPVPIGTGQMADTFRFELTYDLPGDGPSSVVAKFASADEQSHATGRQMRAYEVEVNFYATIAPRVTTRIPGVLTGALDPDEAWFTLLLDDMAGANQGDQIAGCDVDFAAHALAELAALHAPCFEDPALAKLGWLHRSSPASDAFTSAVVQGLFPGFLDRYGDALDDDQVALLEGFVPALDQWFAARTGPATAIHGDFRLDNLLMLPGEARPVVVDFQTAAWGLPAHDLAYFIGGSLEPEIRRGAEDFLFDEYLGHMAQRGCENLSRQVLEGSYRLGSLSGLVMAIGASMLVKRTPRGDEMFLTSTRRHANHALDCDALKLLKGR